MKSGLTVMPVSRLRLFFLSLALPLALAQEAFEACWKTIAARMPEDSSR
jgi:hypothetical protein